MSALGVLREKGRDRAEDSLMSKNKQTIPISLQPPVPPILPPHSFPFPQPLLPQTQQIIVVPLSKNHWIAENAALVRESREADRDLLRLINAHASAVGSSAAALSGIFADVSGLIEVSKLEVRDDRQTLLSNVKDLKDSVSTLSLRIKEAAAADAATTEFHDPSLRVTRVKQVTSAAEFVSNSFKAFREKQKKAYLRLSAAESQLSLEINDFEAALAKEESEIAADNEKRITSEKEKRNFIAVRADMAIQSATRGAVELAAAALDVAAFNDGLNFSSSSSLSPLQLVATTQERAERELQREFDSSMSTKKDSSALIPTIPALRARIAAIDEEVEKLGGLSGGWRDDDHATFKASLSVFLSQRGRPHALSVRHSAAYFESSKNTTNEVNIEGESFRLVLPTPLLDESETLTFLSRLSSLLPYVGTDKLRDHLKWFTWFRERQAEKLGITDLWRKISKTTSSSSQPLTVSGQPNVKDSNDEQTQSKSKGTTPEMRIAVATWRAKRDEEKRREAAEILAQKRLEEALQIEAEKEKREILNERINEWRAGGGGPREVEIAVHLPPTPKPVDARILKKRATKALSEAARVRKELDAAKQALEVASLKKLGDPKRTGIAGSVSASKFLTSRNKTTSDDVFAFWSSLPADPARPTTASHAREMTQADLEVKTAQKKSKSAHEQVIASKGVRSTGRDFTFGGRSSLPSLKTPSWRKGL